MTVIVQPGTDSNGNPQPMVYDQDTGKVIVDSNGFIVSGGQRLINVPSKADYVSTPKTQTAGIQEAQNYIESILQSSPLATVPLPMELSGGLFTIHAGIKMGYITTSVNGFAIYGINQMLTYILVETSDPVFQVNPDFGGQITFANVQPQVQSGYTPDSIVNWNPSSLVNATLIIQHLNGSNGGWVNGTLNISNLANVIMFDHERYNTGLNIHDCQFVTDIAGTNDLNAYQLGGTSNPVSKINNCQEVSIFGAWIGWLDLTGNQYTYIRGNEFQGIVLTGNTGVIDINASGNYLSPFAGANYTNPTIILNASGTSITVQSLKLSLSYWWRQTGAQFSNGNITYGDVEVRLKGINGSTVPSSVVSPINIPTTPSVPASGTAQENTNSYAVDVYIYGGDVTEIQITRNGTAYTVLSVSTAIAMSGQAYKLNPGDSITITYSTAPSWEWLSD